MASASSSIVSTTSQLPTSSLTLWDVFISFRGIDTRYTFTDHLYKALQRTGIRTFMDDPELRSGDAISDGLIQAIQNSKVYVVVFSKNYASSSWCLDELVEILSCHKTMNRLVIPVYHNIDSSVVRHQTKSFKSAFKKHESRPKFGFLRRLFEKDTFHTAAKLEQMEKWRHTLSEVAGFSGQTMTAQRNEADIVNEIVEKILIEINPITLHVAKYPVGLDSHVENITALMSSHPGVTKIGIYGMGGVGKTTLAKAVYNQNYRRFQGSCFLENVRESSVTTRGLVCLQQQLIDNVLKCKNINIDNVNHGIELIKARISSIKVLIVFDDLDDPSSIEFLEGKLALGSIILITTRNEDLLDLINVEAKYKVNELGDAESRQLFAQHAFGDNIISYTSTESFEEILEHAGGLPLALEVFGSNLLNQSEESWTHFSDELKQVSLDVVERKLMISFDALKSVDPMSQDIFLDFACFFMGWNVEEVVKIMETCYTFLGHNIDILKKRSLLTINNRDELGMHDLLRNMGRKIVRNSSPNEPGKHSRLWVSKDICHVLKKHLGTEAIKGIISSNFNHQDALEGVSFNTETFKRMSKLRFLKLNKVKLFGSFEQKFGNLRWLCWDGCPLKYLPLEFYPQKLVILELPHSKIGTMGKLNKVFENLKTLNMKHSLDLTTTPNFNQFPHLEALNFESCESLEEVHMSIGSLERLVILNLHGCVNLRSLPCSICNLRALKSLNIGGCISLKELPIELGNLESLRELNAEHLTVVKLPDSIGRLSNLVELGLNHNKNLKTLPDSICNLRSLNSLHIAGCSGLEELPKELGKIESLTKLNAWGLTVSKLPDSINCLSKLVELNLNDNKYLEIPPSSLSASVSAPTNRDVLSLREKAKVNDLDGNKKASEGGSAARKFTYSEVPRNSEMTSNKQVKFSDTISSIEMDDPDMEGQQIGRDPSANWSSRNSPYTADDHITSYSPYLPPVLEEPSSSSKDDDPLPAVEGLQISGEPYPGRELQASGYSINGTTSCNFEWVRHLEDGSVNYIDGAKQPNYLVSADDVGNYLAIEVQPMDDRKRKVQEEVEHGLRRSARFLSRSTSLRIKAADPSRLKLCFSYRLSLPIFTASKIVDLEKNPLQIILLQTRGDRMIQTTLPYPITIEIVVLDGDFPRGDGETWTSEEFEKNIVRERTGKRPLLTGKSHVTMRDGSVVLGDFEFTDNSSWIRCRKFRIGARVVQRSRGGVKIQEALSEAFVVKDHRGGLYKKHHPPMLEDEVWRLEKIGKDGALHRKLTAEGILTVQDFLKVSVVEQSKLRTILGVGMSEKTWDVTLKHARECVLGSKLYIYGGSSYTIILNPICEIVKVMVNGQTYSKQDLSSLNSGYIENMVKSAYANWNSLQEVDGQMSQTPLLTQGDLVDQYPNNHQTIARSFQQHAFFTDEATSLQNAQAECAADHWVETPAFINTAVKSGVRYNFPDSP